MGRTEPRRDVAAATDGFRIRVACGVQIICKPSAVRPFKSQLLPPPTSTLAPARRADLNDGALLFAVISGNLATSLAGGREQNEQDKHL